jgi:hypothetical protein
MNDFFVGEISQPCNQKKRPLVTSTKSFFLIIKKAHFHHIMRGGGGKKLEVAMFRL